jgi:hypothetical protein
MYIVQEDHQLLLARDMLCIMQTAIPPKYRKQGIEHMLLHAHLIVKPAIMLSDQLIDPVLPRED